MSLRWKTGFEIELLAPRGSTRFDLALRVARWKAYADSPYGFCDAIGQAYTQFGCQQGFNLQDAPQVAELWSASRPT